MRAGYFGPEGTYTQEALLADTAGLELETVPLPTIYDTVMAVHEGLVDRALVPIENSLEGSVNATLDALAMETDDVTIVGEVVHPIRHCLIARAPLELADIEAVVSHPQANAQCARFLRSAGLTPSGTRAVSTFSCADRVGMRLKVWKMNPIEVARTFVRRLSLRALMLRPSSSTVPEVGRSRPPSICSSVLLPCPVGPWMASQSPSSITTSTPCNACTVWRPLG